MSDTALAITPEIGCLIGIGCSIAYVFVAAAIRSIILYDTWRLHWMTSWVKHTAGGTTTCRCSHCDDEPGFSIFLGVFWPIVLVCAFVHIVVLAAVAIGSGRAFRRKAKLPKAYVKE